MLEQLKEALPNIPDEVLSDWLVPFAEGGNWPITEENRWDKRKTGEPLEFWNDAQWELQTLDILNLNYSNGHIRSMRDILAAYRNGEDNDYWRLLGEEGKRRFSRCLIYLLQNRDFPVPPILILTDRNQYQVLDGNHRFAAYLAAQQTFQESQNLTEQQNSELCTILGTDSIQAPNPEQEIWVCAPNWDNSSNALRDRYLLSRGIDIDLL